MRGGWKSRLILESHQLRDDSSGQRALASSQVESLNQKCKKKKTIKNIFTNFQSD